MTYSPALPETNKYANAGEYVIAFLQNFCILL